MSQHTTADQHCKADDIVNSLQSNMGNRRTGESGNGIYGVPERHNKNNSHITIMPD
jgi:hypothetical protein